MAGSRSAQRRTTSPTSSGQKADFRVAVAEAERLLKLAQNSDFQSESADVILAARAFGAPTLEDQARWEAAYRDLCSSHVTPFHQKWKAYPLADQELIASDPGHAARLAIAEGNWGLIPYFPWTSKREVLSKFGKLQQVIGRRAKARDRRGALARWMATNGVPHAAIAKVVYERKDGLRRPSTGKAIAGLSEDREQAMMKQLMGRGFSNTKAERAIYRKARGSEAPAAAQVRMVIKRAREGSQQHTSNLVSPEAHEPLAGLVTQLIRRDVDPQAIPQIATELRRLLTQ